MSRSSHAPRRLPGCADLEPAQEARGSSPLGRTSRTWHQFTVFGSAALLFPVPVLRSYLFTICSRCVGFASGNARGLGGCWRHTRTRPFGRNPVRLASGELRRCTISGRDRTWTPFTPRTYRRKPAMSTIHPSRTIVLAFAAMFVVGLSAPIAVHAEDPLLPVEEQALAPAAMPGPSVSVEDSRVSAAQHGAAVPRPGQLAGRSADGGGGHRHDLGRDEWLRFSGGEPRDTRARRRVSGPRPGSKRCPLGTSTRHRAGVIVGRDERLRLRRGKSCRPRLPACGARSSRRSHSERRLGHHPDPTPVHRHPGRASRPVAASTSPSTTRWGPSSTRPAGSPPASLCRSSRGRPVTRQHPSPGSGGTLREAFANLCGATAMMRAYDQATTTWSTWLTVEPACAAYVEPSSGPR